MWLRPRRRCQSRHLLLHGCLLRALRRWASPAWVKDVPPHAPRLSHRGRPEPAAPSCTSSARSSTEAVALSGAAVRGSSRPPCQLSRSACGRQHRRPRLPVPSRAGSAPARRDMRRLSRRRARAACACRHARNLLAALSLSVTAARPEHVRTRNTALAERVSDPPRARPPRGATRDTASALLDPRACKDDANTAPAVKRK